MALIASRELTKRYPGGVTALSELTLSVERGIIGLVEADGAGKSTFIKIFLGLLAPTSGDVRVLGLDPGTQGTEVRTRVGYMPEHDCLPSELAGDYGSFTRALPRIALRERIRVRQVLPSDESLESVFSYLVGAR